MNYKNHLRTKKEDSYKRQEWFRGRKRLICQTLGWIGRKKLKTQ